MFKQKIGANKKAKQITFPIIEYKDSQKGRKKDKYLRSCMMCVGSIV